MSPDTDAIALAERVLGILDEGSFSATYKFALFTAILDVCIETTPPTDPPPTTITTRQLAEKVVELYWNHAVPYRDRGVLRQGGTARGGQAEILRRIERMRTRWAGTGTESVDRSRRAHQDEFNRLVGFVEWKLIEMPIPRLQVLGGQEERFLYEYNWTRDIRQSTVSGYQRDGRPSFDNRLLLKPGVAERLVRLNGILRPLFHREWSRMVATMNGLPEDELERFLFGAGREPLDAVREPLRALQGDRCFYCSERIGRAAEVDHFIPWSRYADDGLDNLVVADRRCNGSKRDFLAAAEHVERWSSRIQRLDGQLAALARGLNWRRDVRRSVGVARGVYLRLPSTARLWRTVSAFGALERDRIRRALDFDPSGRTTEEPRDTTSA